MKEIDLGTTGYGTYVGEDDIVLSAKEEPPMGGAHRSASSSSLLGRQQPRRKGSQRTSFYGRLGTKRVEAEAAATLSKMETGKTTNLIKQLRVQFQYEEDSYPAGLELELFALLYDKEAKYLDCIFYRNTEDASAAFSLNVATHSMAIDLYRVPEECGVIVLAAAVYTLGMSLIDVEGGRILISEGFTGPVIKQIVFDDLKLEAGAHDASGIIYLSAGERDGQWYYQEPAIFTKPSLDAIMVPSKEVAERMNIEMQHSRRSGLRKLDSLLQEALVGGCRRWQSSDTSSKDSHDSRADVRLQRSIDRANSLREKISKIKSSLNAREELPSFLEEFHQDKWFAKKISSIEKRQVTLEAQLQQLTRRLDYIQQNLGVGDLEFGEREED